MWFNPDEKFLLLLLYFKCPSKWEHSEWESPISNNSSIGFYYFPVIYVYFLLWKYKIHKYNLCTCFSVQKLELISETKSAIQKYLN